MTGLLSREQFILFQHWTASVSFKTRANVRTVPYEGDNFTKSKMDNFSLIFKTSYKLFECFYVNAKQEVYLKVKKAF